MSGHCRDDSPVDDDELGDVLRRFQGAMEAKDSDACAEAANDIISLIAAKVEDDSSEHNRLTIEAGECGRTADWAGAERAYLAVLDLPDLDSVVRFGVHQDLSALYGIINRPADAVRHAGLATETARETNNPYLLAVVLSRQARCLLRYDHNPEAGEVVAELDAIERTEELWDQMKARILVLRACCAIRDARLSDADRDLLAALDLLQAWASVMHGAGVLFDIAMHWLVRGELSEAEHDPEGAVASYQNAVYYGREVINCWDDGDPHSQLFVARTLRRLSAAYSSRGQAADAEAADDERRAILAQVGVPDDG